MEIVVQLHQLPSLRGDPTLVGEQGIISRKLVYLRPFIPFKSTNLDANGNSLSLKLDAHSTLLQSTGNGCSRLIPISICTVMLPDRNEIKQCGHRKEYSPGYSLNTSYYMSVIISSGTLSRFLWKTRVHETKLFCQPGKNSP